MHDLFLSRSFLVLNKDTTYQRKWEKIPLGIKAQMLPNEEKKIVQINLKYLDTGTQFFVFRYFIFDVNKYLKVKYYLEYLVQTHNQSNSFHDEVFGTTEFKS